MKNICKICSEVILDYEEVTEAYPPPEELLGHKLVDVICRDHKDHSFVIRYRGDKVTAVKFKFIEGDKRIFLKIFYETGISQVWISDTYDPPALIITVPQTFDYDIDLDKIRSKIKTILTFN